jgi:hypothetical protein
LTLNVLRARVLGAAVAGAVFVATAAVLWIDASKAVESEQLALVATTALACAIVAGALWGPSVLRSGRASAIIRGLLAGLLAGVMWLVVSLSGTYLSAVGRGATGPVNGTGLAILFFSGIPILLTYGLVVVGLPGMLWAVATRGLARWPLAAWLTSDTGQRSELRGDLRAWKWTAVAMVLLAAGVGLGDARSKMPPGSVCLDLQGDRPVAGAWSPDGSLLAIASDADPNLPGTVRVIRWPSQELVWLWADVWVDQTVAMGPDGHVYWSGTVLGAGVAADDSDGVLEAVPGSTPAWLSTGLANDPVLWSLHWTEGELRGTTANEKQAIRIPLDGPEQGQALALTSVPGPVEALWSSPQGDWLVWRPVSEDLEVSGPGLRRTLEGVHDVRTVSMTADRAVVVVTPWISATYAIDLGTGAVRELISGSQRWSAVSSRGDVAWATDEQDYGGVACVSRFF